MKKVELLAPAGNKEAFFEAINNGADAVYMGGKNFSARAFAENFSNDEFISLIEYAHLRNVRVYVTLNTLLDDFEFKNAIKDVEFYYNNNIDALIIQDLGLYYYIKNKYPDFELHASTQMHVHNLAGVDVVKQLGFKRVVLARESTLDLIKKATMRDIEIEVFVHGAICVSYSGQCLLSSSMKNRSANKGMCAQCCRLKYSLLDENCKKIDTNTDYLLSPKDMFLINDIPSLIDAGVSSLKIEGRMKSSAYVGYVTRMYRRAIDSYYNDKKFSLTKEETSNLKVLFNRGYTNSYLLNDKNDIFGNIYPNHQGIVIGRVLSSNGKKVKIQLNDRLNQFDGVRIVSKDNEDGFIVNKLYKDNKLINSAYKNDIIELETKIIFKNDDVLLKTIDYELEREINNTPLKHIPLDLEINIYANKNVIIKCKDFEYISDIIASSSIKLPLDYDAVFKQFSKIKDSPYYLNKVVFNTDNAFLRLSELNQIRNDFIDKYNLYRLNSFKRTIVLPEIDINEHRVHNNENKDLILFNNKINQYHFNDVVNPDSKYPNDNQVITEIGGLLNNCNKIGYYTLNISNSFAYELLDNLGFNAICLSTELKDTSINELINTYINRTNREIAPYILFKGKRTLMFISRDPFINYDNAKYLEYLDIKYEIRRNRNYIELIENYDSKIDSRKVNHLINF